MSAMETFHPEKPVVTLDRVTKVYGLKSAPTYALSDLSLDVFPGEFLAIMGPSGSGKTTLLNCIATIDRPTSGSILIDGNDVTRIRTSDLSAFRNRELGFLFQDYNLLDTLTLYENLMLPFSIARIGAAKADARIREVAAPLGIAHLLAKFPSQVSGGEKQRAAAARAIMLSPRLILADEPTGALDSQASNVLLQVLTQLQADFAATLLMVTHDAYAASFASRALFLKDGKIIHELLRGTSSRSQYFDRIINVMRTLGGDLHVL